MSQAINPQLFMGNVLLTVRDKCQTIQSTILVLKTSTGDKFLSVWRSTGLQYACYTEGTDNRVWHCLTGTDFFLKKSCT